ncbi:MAG: Fic family protein [Candidatus Lokiarchaeota archaeon]|nr:Fic family protein [Candidatus Lokiarchaeota archaeon]
MLTIPFIVSKVIKGRTYKYLRYAYQEKNKKHIVEMSIGPDEPSHDDLKRLKDVFIAKVVNKRWAPSIDRMKENYQLSLSRFGKESVANYMENFGMRFTYDTNRIEGSTLNFQAVKGILFHDLTPANKPLNDVDEARSHMKVFEEMLATTEELSLALVKKWHTGLFGATKPRIAGSVRFDAVNIKGSQHLPPATRAQVERELDRLFQWYVENKDMLHPVLLACITKFRFVSIHPFDDGNGRVSRLLMNFLLHKAGYPLFNIEFIIRKGYYQALENANMKGDEMAFVHWFFTRYIKANMEYL